MPHAPACVLRVSLSLVCFVISILTNAGVSSSCSSSCSSSTSSSSKTPVSLAIQSSKFNIGVQATKHAAQTPQNQPAAATKHACNMPEASSRKPAYRPPAMRNTEKEQPVAFAVQLYPNMSSLTLVQHDQQQDSRTVFSGHLPPDHHSYTAFHHYIAHVCPGSAGAFGVDVWLDTFHATLGDVELPLSKVAEFQRRISSAACKKLPPVTSLEYTTTVLQQTTKDNRLKKEIKGVHFYHLGLTAAADQFAEVLQPWIAAMQQAAAAVGAKFVQKPFDSHHITIRCHTKAPVKAQAFQKVVHAVCCNPMSLKVAGIRVQLAASQALEHCGPEHVKTYKGSDGSEVRYPVPIYTSGEAASVLLERWHQARDTQAALDVDRDQDQGNATVGHDQAADGQDQAHVLVAAEDDALSLASQLDLTCAISK